MILYTEEYGNGEPLLFLHSGAETGRTDYQEQKAYFSNKFRVIMPDMSGHGYSSINTFSTINETRVTLINKTAWKHSTRFCLTFIYL